MTSLEATLNVSEYTDKVDIQSFTSRPKRIVAQIKELCTILSGLVLSSNYKLGQELFKDRSFEENEAFFATVFEIGRRYNIYYGVSVTLMSLRNRYSE